MLPGNAWIPGVVLRQLGPLTFTVDVGEGRVWRRHIDHLKSRDLPQPVSEAAVQEDVEGVLDYPDVEVVPEVGKPQVTPTAEPHPVNQDSAGNTSVENSGATPVVSAPVTSAPTSINPSTPPITKYPRHIQCVGLQID